MRTSRKPSASYAWAAIIALGQTGVPLKVQIAPNAQKIKAYRANPLFNPTQDDGDMDGWGDLLDPDPLSPFIVGSTDPDGDTYADDHDNCPCSFNPLQEDSDGDGYGDSCDACDYHLVELPIYGRGRVGIAMPDLNISTDLPPVPIARVPRRRVQLRTTQISGPTTIPIRSGCRNPDDRGTAVLTVTASTGWRPILR